MSTANKPPSKKSLTFILLALLLLIITKESAVANNTGLTSLDFYSDPPSPKFESHSQDDDFTWEGEWELYSDMAYFAADRMYISRQFDGTYKIEFYPPKTQSDGDWHPSLEEIEHVSVSDYGLMYNIEGVYDGIIFTRVELYFERTNNPDQLRGYVSFVSEHQWSGNELGWNIVDNYMDFGNNALCASRHNAPIPSPCMAIGVGFAPEEQDTQPEIIPTQEAAPAPGDVGIVASSAGFDVTIGCDARASDVENIYCSMSIYTDEELDDALFNVNWFVDGISARVTGGVVEGDSLSISPLPPGYHQIEVQVSSPYTSYSTGASTVTEVIESSSEDVVAPPSAAVSTTLDMVSPIGQAAAAVGTTAVLAAWLWMEYLNNSRGYDQLQTQLGAQVAQEDADRRDWFQTQSERNQASVAQNLRNEGYVYNAENDVWRPGPGHPEYDQAIIRQYVDRQGERVRTLIQHMPPIQQAVIGDLIDNIVYGDKTGLEALQALATVNHGVNLQLQGEHDMEHAIADGERAWADFGLEATSNVQFGAAFAALTAVGGTLILNPATLAALGGKMAAIQLVGNVTAGAAGGYLEGGMGTAAIRIAQNTLPINAIGSLLDPESSWGDVAWNTLRDVGNVFTVTQGTGYIYQNIVQASAPGSQNLINALHNPSTATADDLAMAVQAGGDDALAAGQSAVDDVAVAGDDIAIAAQAGGDDVLGAGQGAVDDVVAVGDDAAAAGDDMATGGQIKGDAAWQQERVVGQQRIDRFQELVDEYNNPATSGARRVELERQMNQAANAINADYQGSNIIKYNGKPELQQAYNTEVRITYNNVDMEFVDDLNNQGLRIGNRNFTTDDFIDIRNSSSTRPGMDRDLALNQRQYQGLREQLRNATPGTEEAHGLQTRLQEIRRQSQITLNGQPISNAEANQIFQPSYNNTYANVTGTSADDAMQTVTWDQHVEAFGDPNVIKNDPVNYPFQRGYAAQTASVNPQKANHLNNMVRSGNIAEHNAVQEICRGTSKEIQTKIRYLIANDPDLPADRVNRIIEIRRFLDQVGRGERAPMAAMEELNQRFNTDLPSLVREVDTNFEMLIKGQ